MHHLNLGGKVYVPLYVSFCLSMIRPRGVAKPLTPPRVVKIKNKVTCFFGPTGFNYLPKENKGKLVIDRLKSYASDFASTSGFRNLSYTQVGRILSANEIGPISFENKIPISIEENSNEKQKWSGEEHVRLIKRLEQSKIETL